MTGRIESSRAHPETDEDSKAAELEKTPAATQFHPGRLPRRNM